MNVINSLVDNYTKDELEHIVQTSNSMKQVIAKLGYKTQNGRNADTVKRKLDSYDISYDKFNANKGIKREYNDVFCENSTVTQAVLRKWYKKEFGDPSCCSICGQPTLWNGKSLTMILDHIDGDNHNNQENNLRWICPNCNSQLETFAGRNNRSKIINNGKIQYISVNDRKRKTKICPICNINEMAINSNMCKDCWNKEIAKNIPPKEDLEKLIYNTPFTKIGKMYGVTDNAVRKWCKKYGLPFRYGELYKMRA